MNTTKTVPKLISFNKWLAEIGVTDTTGWRWRKKGSIKTVNIYGRLYVSEESIETRILG
jgi:predicted site-specific integrase-resolvase